MRLRKNGFDEDVDTAAANQAAVRQRIVGEIETQRAGLFLPDDILRGRPDFSLDTPASDGSDGGTVIADKHLGGLETGDRTADPDNRRQRRPAFLLLKAADFLVNGAVHRA